MKRIILKGLLICIGFGLLSFTAGKEKPVRFVIVSDLHAQDVPDGKERMQAVVDAANRVKADFLIQLGDFIRFDSTGKALGKVWNGYAGDKYHVLGNHDMDSYTKDEYVAGVGMSHRYYSFDEGDFHFIVLDGNNLFDGKTYRPYGNANYYVDMKMRAYFDPEQLAWLKQDLANTSKRCILFSHQSIDTFANNGGEVRKILEEENERCGFHKVVVAFSGHNHSNYTKVMGGITYIQINSASYVWVEQSSHTEKRYPQAVNERFPLLSRSITYDRPLYAVVTLTHKGMKMKGTKGKFLPPAPKEIGLGDSIDSFPLVPFIKDVKVKF